MSNGVHAFTVKADGLLEAIITNGFSSPPVKPEEIKNLKPTPTKQLWDTGATHCAITKSLVKKLKLTPIGRTEITYGSGTQETDVHLIHVVLPNNVIIPNVMASQCDDGKGEFEMIIGMDIINQGDFSITNVEGTTTISFRLPSLKEIDYVVEINKSNAHRDKTRGPKFTPPKKRRKKR